MPIALITLILAVLLGLYAPQRTALAVTGIAATLTVVAFVVAVTDGKGNDPGWLIAVGIGCAAAAVAVCAALSSRRARSISQP